MLALEERRAVGDGEERQAEARDEECRDDRGLPRVARQRHRRQPQRQGPTAADAPQRSQAGQQQPHGPDRGCEGDEGGKEQDEPVSLAGRERVGVDRAVHIAERDKRHCRECRDVERREPETAGVDGCPAHRQEEEQRRRCSGTPGGCDATAGEQRVFDDLPCGRARP